MTDDDDGDDDDVQKCFVALFVAAAELCVFDLSLII